MFEYKIIANHLKAINLTVIWIIDFTTCFGQRNSFEMKRSSSISSPVVYPISSLNEKQKIKSLKKKLSTWVVFFLQSTCTLRQT